MNEIQILRPSDVPGRLPENDIHGRWIWEAVREGLWPFRARDIAVWLEYDIDFNRYRIFAEARFAKPSPFRIAHFVKMDAEDLYDNLEGEVFRAAEEMLWAFRNREDYPLWSTIKLGEN